MVKRRAVEKSDELAISDNLPLFYKTITPLTPERHSDLHVSRNRNFQFAAQANAIPITCDEFSQALRFYPIVIANPAAPIPVALVGLQNGVNDHVNADGSWKEGDYIPAFLRRYPFMMLRESKEATRNILCADMSSTLLTNNPDEGEALFGEGGASTDRLTTVLDFCTRYDSAAARTRMVMKEAKDLGLIQQSTVDIRRGDKKGRIEGFSMIAEDKLRALPDDKLASLAKRGVLTIFAAHHLSMANFSDFGELA